MSRRNSARYDGCERIEVQAGQPVDARVVHQVPSHRLLARAEHARPILRQAEQQLRVLEAATRQHVRSRPSREIATREAAHPQSRHHPRGRLDVDADDGGVEQRSDAAAARDGCLVPATEILPADDEMNAWRESAAVEQPRGGLVLPELRRERTRRAESKKVRGRVDARVDFRPRDRPAGQRDPRTGVEVDRIERDEAPVPEAAAEAAVSRGAGSMARRSGIGELVQVGRRLIDAEAARLQEQHGPSELAQMARDREASGPGADHADVGVDDGT